MFHQVLNHRRHTYRVTHPTVTTNAGSQAGHRKQAGKQASTKSASSDAATHNKSSKSHPTPTHAHACSCHAVLWCSCSKLRMRARTNARTGPISSSLALDELQRLSGVPFVHQHKSMVDKPTTQFPIQAAPTQRRTIHRGGPTAVWVKIGFIGCVWLCATESQKRLMTNEGARSTQPTCHRRWLARGTC